MSFLPDGQTLSRMSHVVNIAFYVVLALIAALWWVPAALGDDNTVPWIMAALCYVWLWAYVFNDLPRFGVRGFSRRATHLAAKLVFLVVVGVAFGYGFLFCSAATCSA